MNIKNIVSAVEVPPFFFQLAVTAISLTLFALPYDDAHARHTDACMRLSDASPPSPRAECLARRPPGAPAGPCTRLTNASPPSPRAECLARLPPLPPLRISSARFRHDGGTTIMTRVNGVLFVRGTNVAAPGVVARRDGNAYTVGPYADPTCVPPGCAALRIETMDETGPQTFRLLAPDGHQVARGTFTIVPHPAPAPVSGGNPRPPVSGRSGSGSGGGNPCVVMAGGPRCPNNTTFDPATCSCR